MIQAHPENIVTVEGWLHGEYKRTFIGVSTAEVTMQIAVDMLDEQCKCGHQVSLVTRWYDGETPGLVYLLNPGTQELILKTHTQHKPD